jgi:hypothetical protein
MRGLTERRSMCAMEDICRSADPQIETVQVLVFPNAQL